MWLLFHYKVMRHIMTHVLIKSASSVRAKDVLSCAPYCSRARVQVVYKYSGGRKGFCEVKYFTFINIDTDLIREASLQLTNLGGTKSHFLNLGGTIPPLSAPMLQGRALSTALIT